MDTSTTKNDKYEFTNNVIICEGKSLIQIRALKDFGNVRKGDLGGYIESEKNLSKYGDCWIYDYSKVYGDCIVSENSVVKNFSIVKDNCFLYGNTNVSGSQLYGKITTSGDVTIRNSIISGKIFICNISTITDSNITMTGIIRNSVVNNTSIRNFSQDETLIIELNSFINDMEIDDGFGVIWNCSLSNVKITGDILISSGNFASNEKVTLFDPFISSYEDISSFESLDKTSNIVLYRTIVDDIFVTGYNKQKSITSILDRHMCVGNYIKKLPNTERNIDERSFITRFLTMAAFSGKYTTSPTNLPKKYKFIWKVYFIAGKLTRKFLQQEEL